MRYDDEDDDDRPRRKKKRRKESSGPPIGLILGILGGVVVIAAGVVGAYFALRSKPKAESDSTPALASGKPTDQWIEFRHPEGLYTVKMPCVPEHSVLPRGGAVLATNSDGVNSCVFGCRHGELLVAASVELFPPGRSPEQRLGDRHKILQLLEVHYAPIHSK